MTDPGRDHHVSTPAVTSDNTPTAGYQIRRINVPEATAARTAPLALPDGSVIIPARLVPAVRRALAADLANRRRTDGGALTPDAHAFLYALRRAAEPGDNAPAEASSAAATAPREPGTVKPDAHGGRVVITVGEAAALLGSSAEWVRRLVRSGRIPAQRIGTQWLIDRAAFDNYRHRKDAA